MLTKEQQTEVDNMEIQERVELIREMFWNGVQFGESYKDIIEPVPYETTPENMEHFLMGATAMFDVAQMMTANHWHGDPETNKLCQMENDYVYRVMEVAFEEINPAKMMIWKELQN